MNVKTAVLTAALISAGLAVSAAQAATTSSTMPVTITIQNACNVSSVAPTTLNFGTQGPLLAAVNQTSTITVTCTKSAPYNIGLDGGTSGNVNARTMVNGANSVGYQLYSDSGRNTIWGNTIGTNTVASTGTGSAQAFTVYGQVPAQTTPPAATYNDTVNVTVTY
ncbi:MAG TPA: spore coat U domain-containing protein [Rhodanobacteraceae bacterium]|nr:spore coat U domain-containing protein [Rhodanobacteraceae bacterium]